MNNKPVAWMLLGLEDRKPKLINLQVIDHLEGTWIPLYTHPAKTLTISDKDILKIIHDKFTKFGFESDYIVEDIELIEFAKEILRKAQEK